MYQILQKFDIHWHDGGPSIAMMYHLRRVSDLLCNWKSCLLCYMKDVVLHCSIFFKWNKLVRVRVRVRVQWEHQEQILLKFESNCAKCLSTKCIWQCFLQNFIHFVQVSTCGHPCVRAQEILNDNAISNMPPTHFWISNQPMRESVT